MRIVDKMVILSRTLNARLSLTGSMPERMRGVHQDACQDWSTCVPTLSHSPPRARATHTHTHTHTTGITPTLTCDARCARKSQHRNSPPGNIQTHLRSLNLGHRPGVSCIPNPPRLLPSLPAFAVPWMTPRPTALPLGRGRRAQGKERTHPLKLPRAARVASGTWAVGSTLPART